jgi:uncharacterized protein (UPF0332 family)
MDGQDFIALAGRLAVAPIGDEAKYRTAVSRAYYGAFHVARSFLAELGFAPLGNANVHGFVRHYLNGSHQPDACLAASHLSRLQAARNEADYDLDDPDFGSQAVAMASVELAHRVVSALESCRTPDDRESIRQAIAEYQKKTRPK